MTTARLRNGVVSRPRLLSTLREKDCRIDATTTGELGDLLAVAGEDAWLWPRTPARNPLATALARIAGLGRPVPLAQIPAAVARSVTPHRTIVSDEWPLPAEAVRAWVRHCADWELVGSDRIHPVRPGELRLPPDQRLVEVLAHRNQALPWKKLHAALVDTGLSAPSSTVAIVRSPLLRRARNGYVLLG